MSWVFPLVVAVLLCLLTLAAYIDRIYFEIGKVLSREYTDNIEAWEGSVEPLLKLSRESAALSASVLRQITLVVLAFLLTFRLYGHAMRAPEVGRAALELLLVLVF